MGFRHLWVATTLTVLFYAVPAAAQSASNGGSSVEDRWMPLVEVDGLLIEIDIHRSEGLRNANPSAWTRWTYSEPHRLSDGSATYSVAMNHVSYDCSSREISEEQVTYYDYVGNVVRSRGRTGWVAAVPNSVGEGLLDAVCYVAAGLDEPAEWSPPISGGVARS